MPHPTTPSEGKAAMGSSYLGEGRNSQAARDEFKTTEQTLIATPLSITSSPTEIRLQHATPTPPQSPSRSPLCKHSTHQAVPNIPSPPSTPESQRYPKVLAVSSQHKKASITANEKETQVDGKNRPLEDIAQTTLVPVGALAKGPRPYEGTFELQLGTEGQYEEYGRGAWSVVYCAEHTPNNGTGNGKGDIAKMMVAVKAPLYQGSTSILEHEALILTHLTQTTAQSESAHHIVTFFGYDISTKSLILEPVPLTLATYSKAYALEAKKNFSRKTMRDPIVGTRCWLQIVRQLVEGLGFLQTMNVVHGDIKPSNILMRQRGGSGGGSLLNSNNESTLPGGYHDTATTTALSYTPLFCDFSSSRLITSSDPPSALTSSFAAPELLNPRTPGIATFASDIYSLAISLLCPALGADVYSGATNAMQALYWAKEGKPLDFARSGDAGLRVAKGGIVERILGGALRRMVEDRWGIDEWDAVIMGVMNGNGGDEGLGK